MSKSIEEIIERLEQLINVGPGIRFADNFEYIEEAIAILKSCSEAQPNEPLTFDELLDMSGKPVWVEFADGTSPTWGVALGIDIYFPLCTYCEAKRENFGVAWKAYRRPPEEKK